MVEEIGVDCGGDQYVIVDGVKHYFDRGFTIINDKPSKLKIERVIFNAPATIVFWNDGTKTVVKCRECLKGVVFRDCCSRCAITKKWKRTGIIAACLKKTFPNYLDEIRRLGVSI